MTVNNSRSMNQDLQLGILDGRLKTILANRGGQVESHDFVNDMDSLSPQYGITDKVHHLVQGCGCPSCAML